MKPPAASPIFVFDRALVKRHRNAAARNFSAHSALSDEVGEHLLDRLMDVTRPFPNILDLGARNGFLAGRLAERPDAFVVSADLSEAMVRQSSVPSVVADEEFLPFAARSFHLVISNLSLHWVNDLPGALAQINHTLRPEGLFIGALLGGNTLLELRTCLMEAEIAITGGMSPRLSPTVELLTMSGLLQRAGFDLPVADQETIIMTYPDAFALMRDLRGMGEGNANMQRLKQPTRRAVFDLAAHIYAERFAEPDGRIRASFDVIFIHGWKPKAQM